ncbi:MAG: hypothetical protein RLZZ347_254 [Candidatus Parcubacteria bacterium]|jgi:hypothetical protein
MEAWRVFKDTEAKTKAGRLGRVLEVFIDSGSLKIKWLDTEEIEVISASTIVSTRKVSWEDPLEEPHDPEPEA